MPSSFRSAQELLKEADITTKTPWPNRTPAVSPCALPRSKPVSPQDPDAEMRSANSFTALDTLNRTAA
jgi:hypothetical protein